MAKEPELFQEKVRYERFILVKAFNRLKRKLNPVKGESVTPVMGKVPRKGKPDLDVVIGVNLSLFTKKGASDAKRLFEDEEGK